MTVHFILHFRTKNLLKNAYWLFNSLVHGLSKCISIVNVNEYVLISSNNALNFLGRINCKSYSAEDRSSIENDDEDLQDIGDDQVRLQH